MKKLYEKLAKMQRELKAPKSQRNKFGNYNYRSAEDILEAVKPLLEGLTLITQEELINMGDRFYVKSTAILSDGENSISTSAFARESLTKKGMDESQITGAAGSYAKKYSLNHMFAIDDTKDSDSTNTHGVDDNAKKVTKKPTASKIEEPKPVEETKVESPAEPTKRRRRG